jgi:hypothetical protein
MLSYMCYVFLDWQSSTMCMGKAPLLVWPLVPNIAFRFAMPCSRFGSGLTAFWATLSAEARMPLYRALRSCPDSGATVSLDRQR